MSWTIELRAELPTMDSAGRLWTGISHAVEGRQRPTVGLPFTTAWKFAMFFLLTEVCSPKAIRASTSQPGDRLSRIPQQTGHTPGLESAMHPPDASGRHAGEQDAERCGDFSSARRCCAIERWHCRQLSEMGEHDADPSGREAGRHTPQHCSVLSTAKRGAENDHRSRASMLP
jgi:hypothetical protein